MSIKTLNSSTYYINDLGDIMPYVVVGGSSNKFVPNLNTSFLMDGKEKYYINLNRKNRIVNDEIQEFINDKIKLKINKETDEFYIDDKGRFKWDIVFDEIPTSMSIEWELKFSKELSFNYQDDSSIEPGDIRPDDVKYSYAVYCDKQNGKHKTGKLCHIYRPYIIDNGGSKEWVEIEINDKSLKIILPSEFMTNAFYPVRLDPSIGYTSIGASEGALSTLRALLYNCTMTENGTANSINVYMRYYTAVTDTVQFGIYNDNAGAPGTVFDGPDTYAVTDVADAWQTHQMSGNLVNGVKYYPAIRYNGGGNTYYHYDAITGDQSTSGSSTFTDNPTGMTANTRRISMYIDYTASGVTLTQNYYRNLLS